MNIDPPVRNSTSIRSYFLSILFFSSDLYSCFVNFLLIFHFIAPYRREKVNFLLCLNFPSWSLAFIYSAEENCFSRKINVYLLTFLYYEPRAKKNYWRNFCCTVFMNENVLGRTGTRLLLTCNCAGYFL